MKDKIRRFLAAGLAALIIESTTATAAFAEEIVPVAELDKDLQSDESLNEMTAASEKTALTDDNAQDGVTTEEAAAINENEAGSSPAAADAEESTSVPEENDTADADDMLTAM